MAAVTGAAVILGSRPTAGPAQWIEATAFLTLFVFAITWLSVGLGLAASSVEIAWSIGIALASYLWARKLFSRDPSRT